MGGGRGPQAVTFTLQVELDQLDETSQQEIREQLDTLLLSVGASDVTFEPFEEGSTIVTAISKKSFSVDTLKEKITKMDEVQTIQYTVKDSDPKDTKTTVFSKVDDEELIYSNDLILVDTNNNTEYTDVGVDGVITRAIVDAAVDRTTIQCVICGGNARTIADYDSKKAEDTTVFGLITTLTTVNLGQVNEIGDAAFGGCTSLTDIDFKQVQTIGGFAFSGCTSLTDIDFKQVQAIGDVAFGGCIALTDIDLGQVQTIGVGAFSGCTSLREVRLKVAQAWTIPLGCFFQCPVVKDSVDNPFLVANTITSIAFASGNEVFSSKSVLTPPGGLELVDYGDDYKRVKVV